MSPLLVAHASLARNRLSIFRRGLLARDTTDHNYPDMYGSHNDGVKRVYACYKGERPWWSWRFSDTPTDLWLADVAGMAVEDDRDGGDGMVRVVGSIPPDRLRLAVSSKAALVSSS